MNSPNYLRGRVQKIDLRTLKSSTERLRATKNPPARGAHSRVPSSNGPALVIQDTSRAAPRRADRLLRRILRFPAGCRCFESTNGRRPRARGLLRAYIPHQGMESLSRREKTSCSARRGKLRPGNLVGADEREGEPPDKVENGTRR